MHSHLRVAALIALVVVGAASAQQPVEYVYDGEVFKIEQHPDSECCFKVSYEDVVGYVGVWVGGTAERPYGYSTNSTSVSPDGLTSGNVGYSSAEECLRRLARSLLSTYRENQSRLKFDPKKARDELREYIESISRPQTPAQAPELSGR